MEFKTIIETELDIDYNTDKAALESILTMTVTVKTDVGWLFVSQVRLPKKVTLKQIEEIFEDEKNKFLNKQKEQPITSNDPDDIPF